MPCFAKATQGVASFECSDEMSPDQRAKYHIYPVDLWIVGFAGFTEDESRPGGIVRLIGELDHRYSGRIDCGHVLEAGHHRCRVEFRPWHDRVEPLAETIFRRQPESVPPRILVACYSWGVATAMRFAAALADRGLEIDHLVSADGVYRHGYPLGWWRALLPWKRIVVPDNVRQVSAFYQRSDWPRGHKLVRADGSQRAISWPSRPVPQTHRFMDDAAGFQTEVRQRASELSKFEPDNRLRVYRP